MSEFKGTPGPWVVHDGNVRTENPGRCVARLDWAVRDHIDDENARLIAAAPDLLEALIAAENLFHHTFAAEGTIHKQIRAAIAKALQS